MYEYNHADTVQDYTAICVQKDVRYPINVSQDSVLKYIIIFDQNCATVITVYRYLQESCFKMMSELKEINIKNFMFKHLLIVNY